jgi:hypothetical protein
MVPRGASPCPAARPSRGRTPRRETLRSWDRLGHNAHAEECGGEGAKGQPGRDGEKSAAGDQTRAVKHLPLGRQRRSSRPRHRGRFRRLRPKSPGQPAGDPRTSWRVSCSPLIPAAAFNIGQASRVVKRESEKYHTAKESGTLLICGAADPVEADSCPDRQGRTERLL